MALRSSAKFTSFLKETQLRKWCGDIDWQLCILSRWRVKPLRLTTLQAFGLFNQVCSPSLIRTRVSRRLRKPKIGSLFRNEDLSGSLDVFIFDKLCYSWVETIGKYCRWIKPIRATLDLRISLKVPSRTSGQQCGRKNFFRLRWRRRSWGPFRFPRNSMRSACRTMYLPSVKRLRWICQSILGQSCVRLQITQSDDTCHSISQSIYCCHLTVQ